MRFQFPALKYRAEHDLERTVSVRLLDYITPGIWVTFFMTAVATWSVWALVSSAFSSGAVLNGTIIATGLVGVMRSVWSNYRLWVTAKYLHTIDAVKTRSSPVDADQMLQFRRKLKGEASLLDTKQMADLLENLPTMGHLNITDNDARMIKSKLGFRISLMRSNVAFLAGILVMLGLLGTFLGLLQTINSVGEAMGGMSKIGGADPEAMSGFLASIAAPLQGMGLAFSSSLFGLSGSLLLSFVNFLAGGVHDRFIERVSRWVDDRIPTPSQEARKAQGNPRVAGSDELKAWLAGFVQTALETNRRIETLVGALAEQMKQAQTQARATKALLTLEKENAEELKELRRSFTRGLAVVRKEVNDRAVEVRRAVRTGSQEVDAVLSRSSNTITLTPGAERSVHESRTQLSSLVDELQALLDSQDVMAAFRARQSEVDSEGLPPTFHRDRAQSQQSLQQAATSATQDRRPE